MISGALELHEPLEAVVAVDDAAVEVVQVAGREAAAVELDHRADLRRDDGQHVDDHPLGLVAAQAEGVHDLQALDDTRLLLAARALELGVELLGERLEVDLLQAAS